MKFADQQTSMCIIGICWWNSPFCLPWNVLCLFPCFVIIFCDWHFRWGRKKESQEEEKEAQKVSKPKRTSVLLDLHLALLQQDQQWLFLHLPIRKAKISVSPRVLFPNSTLIYLFLYCFFPPPLLYNAYHYQLYQHSGQSWYNEWQGVWKGTAIKGLRKVGTQSVLCMYSVFFIMLIAFRVDGSGSPFAACCVLYAWITEHQILGSGWLPIEIFMYWLFSCSLLNGCVNHFAEMLTGQTVCLVLSNFFTLFDLQTYPILLCNRKKSKKKKSKKNRKDSSDSSSEDSDDEALKGDELWIERSSRLLLYITWGRNIPVGILLCDSVLH